MKYNIIYASNLRAKPVLHPLDIRRISDEFEKNLTNRLGYPADIHQMDEGICLPVTNFLCDFFKCFIHEN